MSIYIRYITIFTITISNLFVQTLAQKAIGYESEWGERKPSSPDELILKQNVVFTHEGMIMYCDSAVLNKTTNTFSAFGYIEIIQNDTIHLTGNEVYYDGNTKIAEIMGDIVVLKDGKTTLITDYLVLERIPNIARYTTSAIIYDEKDTLESIFGIYFFNDKVFNFTDQVHIKTQTSEIFSDTIYYNTKTDVANCFGATTIVKKDSAIIYTEKGNYNTKTTYFESFSATKMTQNAKTIIADTLFYDAKLKKGEAFSNIYIEDTTNHISSTGNYANINTIDSLTYTFLTDSALIIHIDKNDTLYFHADTLLLVTDTSNNARDIFGYKHAKLFRNDFQGASEFAHYKINDSLLTMVERPVLWNEKNQLTADTIILLFSNKKIYQMKLFPNALIIQDADSSETERYNQIFGRVLIVFFHNGKIKEADIEGNAQSIYYIWDEKKDKAPQLIGINTGNSSKMRIYFDKGKMKRLVGIENPEYKLNNEDDVPVEERKLKGFIWVAEDRPLQPSDIFIKRK
ncbi:MAG: hypothetical protein LBR28_07755 [Bacteroidales bacterium]|jgi:lipopolysaccharide export system protein LptA|nr:hypothetical protein [Bacteroidales bacterium]